MTRSQLITKVANDTNMTSAEVEKVMDGIFGTIGDVLKSGDKVKDSSSCGRTKNRLKHYASSGFLSYQINLGVPLLPNAAGRGIIICLKEYGGPPRRAA